MWIFAEWRNVIPYFETRISEDEHFYSKCHFYIAGCVTRKDCPIEEIFKCFICRNREFFLGYYTSIAVFSAAMEKKSSFWNESFQEKTHGIVFHSKATQTSTKKKNFS